MNKINNVNDDCGMSEIQEEYRCCGDEHQQLRSDLRATNRETTQVLGKNIDLKMESGSLL